MNYPGTCKLQLSDAAICQALEGAINAARKDGEDYVRVTEIKREGYGYGDFVLTITTDVPQADMVTMVMDELSREAA